MQHANERRFEEIAKIFTDEHASIESLRAYRRGARAGTRRPGGE
jgi:hypothetical protein